MTRADFATYLSLALTVPFVAWGLYLLRARFLREREISMALEAVTLGLLIIFYAFQFALIEALLADSLLQFVGTSLLLVSLGAALYGPMLTSLMSRVLVGVFLPDGEAPVRTPHFGAGERMERLDDYEGALLEYESVARLFPDHPDVMLRLASTLARLGRYEDAAAQLERSVALSKDPEESYPLVARLVEILDHDLGHREEAIAVLGRFVMRFPGSDEAERAQRRADRLSQTPAALAPTRPAVMELGELDEEEDESGMPGALLPGLSVPPVESGLDTDDDDDSDLPGSSLPGSSLPTRPPRS